MSTIQEAPAWLESAAKQLALTHREGVHKERALLAARIDELQAVELADAQRFDERIATLAGAVADAQRQLADAQAKLASVRREKRQASQPRQREIDALRRHLTETADPSIAALAGKLSAQYPSQARPGEPIERAERRTEALHAALARLDALQYEALPPADLDRELSALRARIPN